MKNLQMFDTLKTFTREEFKVFGTFLNSPYFNNRSEVIRFYDAIKKLFPDFKTDKLKEEKIFKQIYPGKKYNDVLMRKVISLFSKLILDYIAISAFKENQLDYNVKMLYKLYDRNLNDLFKKRSKTFESLLENSKHSVDYYEAKFKYISKLNAFRSDEKEKGSIEKYQDELDEFIEYFTSVSLLIFHRLITFTNIYNIKYQMWFYDELFNHLSINNFQNKTLVSIYYNMVKLSETEEKKYFLELINCSKKFEDKLTSMFQNNIFISLFNHCLNRIYKGEFEFRNHLFTISQLFSKKDNLRGEQKYINSFLFTGIVRNSAYLKQFKWTEEFISKNEIFLEPETKKEILNYSHAMLEFEKGNYDNSLSHLSKSNPDKLVMKLNAKNLTVMIYYELGYADELYAMLDAYKHFINNNSSIGETQKTRNAKFINAVAELLKIKLNKKTDGALEFIKKIENSGYFILKEWVLEKAKNL